MLTYETLAERNESFSKPQNISIFLLDIGNSMSVEIAHQIDLLELVSDIKCVLSIHIDLFYFWYQNS